jgi:hypothetical protein
MFQKPFGLSAAIFLLCFGSIWTLLGFTWGLAPMHVLGLALLLPTLLGIAGLWAFAARAGHDELHKVLLAGVVGGIWGTLGYDLIRIPLHFLGMNPFAPIRSYGMYVTDSPYATVWTDWAGAGYHFSNGLTFGIMYALLMRNRHWAWAVLWGLVLETFAVVTAYGAMYNIRTNYEVLGIAYFAHLYYGLPLGWAVANLDRLQRVVSGARRGAVWGATAAGVAFVLLVLAMAWERPWTVPDLPAATIRLGPDAVYRGWTRIEGGRFTVLNAADHEVSFQVKGAVEPRTLAPGEAAELSIDRPGLYQIIAPEEPWRSAFLSIERDGFPIP